VHTDFGGHNFDQARAAAFQPDGKIVAAGFASSPFGTMKFAVARYRANGAIDTTFSGDGKTQIDFGSCCASAHSVLVQAADSKLIVVGYPNSESSDSDFTLARLNPNGSLDAGFGNGGKVRTSFGDLNGGAQSAALQPDGRIVAVGFQATNTPKWAQFALARYLNDGSAVSATTPRR
jgi:uncharacterized delta-60 repeat protein